MRNPLQQIVVWATATPYPGGIPLWSGTATKVGPGYTYFTPGVAAGPAAQELNAILNQRDTWIANLNTWTQALDGSNWKAPVALSTIGSGAGSSVQWSFVLGAWVAFEVITGSAFVYYSLDGVTWAQLGTAALSATSGASGGLVSTPAGYLLAFQGNLVATQTYNPATNVWAPAAAGPGGTFLGGLASTIRNFSGVTPVVVWAQAYPTGGVSAPLAWSADNGATWTLGTGALPTTFGMCAFTTPLFAASGASLVCLFSQTPSATQYITSPDGKAWTIATQPSFLAGEVIVGADYDSANGIFYIVYSSSTTTRVFASSSGTGSWSLVATISHPASVPGRSSGGFGAIAANGGELALLLQVAGIWRVMLSIDGGVTWGFARSVTAFAGTGWLQATEGVFVYSDTTNYAIPLFQVGRPPRMLI